MATTQKPTTDFFDKNLKLLPVAAHSRLLLLDKHLTDFEKGLSTAKSAAIAESSSVLLDFAKDGTPIPIVAGRPLHSRFFPKKEATRSVANLPLSSSHYVVLTQDFLYGLEEMCMRHSRHFEEKHRDGVEKKLHLLWCVLDHRLLLQLLHTRSLAFLKNFSSITFFFCSSSIQETNCAIELQNYAMAIAKKDFRGFLFFENPHKHFDAKRPFFHRLKILLAEWGKLLASQKLTETLLQRRWWVNGLLNLERVSKIDFFESLHNAHARAVALVLASGPSLDEQIDEIVEFVNGKTDTQFIVIATDSALPVLASRKLVPDYVVALDAGYYNTLDFNESYQSFQAAGRRPCLIMHPSLYPSVLRLPLFSQIYCFFTASCNAETPTNTPVGETLFSSLLESIAGKVASKTGRLHKDTLAEKQAIKSPYANVVERSILNCGSSVASVAVEAAVAMGVKNLIFFGLDMCYPFLHSHASFSMHDRYRLKHSYRFSPREQGDFLSLQSLNVSNNSKNTVTTEKKNTANSTDNLEAKGVVVGPLQLQYREEMLAQIARAAEKGVKCYSRSSYFFASGQHFGKLIFLKNLKNLDNMQEVKLNKEKGNRKLSIKRKTYLKESEVEKILECWHKAVLKVSILLNRWLTEKSKTTDKVQVDEALGLLMEILSHLKKNTPPLYMLFETNGMGMAALQGVYETDSQGDRLPYQKVLAEMQRQFRVFLNYLPFQQQSAASDR